MLLSDWEVRALCLLKDGMPVEDPMIHPFSEGVSGGGIISFGLTHAGYDLRLGTEIMLFKNSYNEIVDPKRFGEESYRRKVFDVIQPTGGGFYLLPPHSYALGYSVEHLSIPSLIKGRCVGKSTLARCGILINTTPLEPGWKGHLTIEISNITPCPAVIYAGEGIAQLEFDRLSSAPERTYEGKKYQGQGAAAVPAKVIS